MQIETTISTLYNVKKCLEEEINEMNLDCQYFEYQMKQILSGNVHEEDKKWAEKYKNLYNKLYIIKGQLQSAIDKL